MASKSRIDFFNTVSLSLDDIHRFKISISPILLDHHIGFLKLFISTSFIFSTVYFLHRLASYNDNIPIVNRRFTLEPRIFARIRWAFGSIKILDDAYEKVN